MQYSPGGATVWLLNVAMLRWKITCAGPETWNLFGVNDIVSPIQAPISTQGTTNKQQTRPSSLDVMSFGLYCPPVDHHQLGYPVAHGGGDVLWEHVDVILQRAHTLVGLGMGLDSTTHRTAGEKHLQVPFCDIQEHHWLGTQLQQIDTRTLGRVIFECQTTSRRQGIQEHNGLTLNKKKRHMNICQEHNWLNTQIQETSHGYYARLSRNIIGVTLNYN